jgi:hypothetical protein
MNSQPNIAVDNLVTELSPELAGVIGQPPEISDSPPPRIPGVSASEKSNIEKTAAAAADATRANGGISRKFGVLAKTIQGLDRIRVFKRQPNGVVGYIEEYRYRDIQHTGDLEVFLAQYVKPIHGPGEYPIRLWDSSGKEWDGGIIHLLGAPPAPPSTQSDLASVVRELKDAVRPAPPPDPFEQMRRTRQMMKDLKEESGGDPVMMMMMMQSMTQPKTDPGLAAVIERLTMKIEKLEQQAATPPMPMFPMAPSAPPLSAMDIANLVTTSLKTVVDLVKPAAPATPAIDPFAMAKMLSDASKEGAAAAEKNADRLISMLENRDRREQPVASLTDEMEKMKTLHEFVKSFSPQQAQQGSTGTNFWDAILAFANNEKFAGNIGEAIRERAKQQPGQATITSNKPVPAKQIPQNTQQQGQQPQQQPQQQRPQTAPPPFVPGTPQQAAPAPAPQQQQAAPPSPAPQPEVVPAAEAQQAPVQNEPPTQQPGSAIYLPEAFRPFCTRLDTAASEIVDLPQQDGSVVKGIDDGAIAQCTIQVLMELFKLAQFRPAIQDLLSHIDQDQKQQSMMMLGNALGLLSRSNWVKRDSALAALRVLDQQWDIVRTGVQQLLKTVPLFTSPPTPITPPAPSSPEAPADVPQEIIEAAGNSEDDGEGEPPPG